ncbi:FtsB family cell division protein [Lutispora thermophila]|uniref:Cell division protein FtsL n=1 Tax=Lutispora thermophila DSM 19022 TaxID=1122184 RepID=A0A1M6GF04_9FIRM|nr:septum formation initiator family protein [Lutispora thermophila]SHJ08509.1 cell division protein FtsL [Lutispora thermophila DSM 19022]
MKNKRKKKIIWTNFFVFIFMIYAIFTIGSQQVTIYKLKKSQQQITDKIEMAKKENERLQEMLKDTSSKEYIEKMAREQLGLVKADEKVYVDQSLSDVNLQEGGN